MNEIVYRDITCFCLWHLHSLYHCCLNLPCWLITHAFYKHMAGWWLLCDYIILWGKHWCPMTSVLPFFHIKQDTLVFAVHYYSLVPPPSYCQVTVYPRQINLPSYLVQKTPWFYWALIAAFLQLKCVKPLICILLERTVLWDVKLLMMHRFQASIFTSLRIV